MYPSLFVDDDSTRLGKFQSTSRLAWFADLRIQHLKPLVRLEPIMASKVKDFPEGFGS